MRAIALGVLAFAVVAAGSALGWRAYRLPARIAAGLPAEPRDLAKKPRELAARLASARTATRTRSGALAAVAELGRLLHANGYLAEAEQCWALLQAEQPREPRWPYYLADARRTAGDYSAVVQHLERTARLAPDYAAAWLQLADLEFKTGQLQAADRHYQERLSRLPRDPYARLGRARVALQSGRRAEARALIEQIVQDTPDFPSAHNLYAEMLAAEGNAVAAARHRRLGREAGRFREADDPWREELTAWCLDPKRLAMLSTVQYQTQRGDRGQALLERAVQLAPDDPNGYEMLGTLRLRLGQAEQARDALERGRALAPDGPASVMLHVNLAEAYRLLRQPEQALRVTQEGLARSPEAFELHNELGAVRADLGRLAEAESAYHAALARAPNDTDSNYSLGVTLLALGRPEEARVFLQRSLALQPTLPKSLLLLARIELDADRLEAVGNYVQPLLANNPDLVPARQLAAQWHWRCGEAAAPADPAAAERHYREGLATWPDHPELNASLGVLCLLQNRDAEALAPLEAYRRLRPNDAQSALFLGQVYVRLGRIPEAKQILAAGRELALRAGSRSTAAFCQEILDRL